MPCSGSHGGWARDELGRRCHAAIADFDAGYKREELRACAHRMGVRTVPVRVEQFEQQRTVEMPAHLRQSKTLPQPP